jgi:two-component system alkaline phosphatase synthesis response regulator PhoP
MEMEPMPRILLIEDNRNLAVGLRNNLEIEGHRVELAPDGMRGLALARSWRPELIILDLMLPGLDGYRVLRTLRDEGCTVPVLVLTARGEESDKVLGFRHGADDYVTKPFGLLELIARVEALMRRARTVPRPPALMSFGEIEIDSTRHEVSRAGAPVALRPKEFDLLIALCQRAEEVVTRNELLREVWGYDASVVSRTVDTHILELRRKLERDPANPRHILTVRKTGYRLTR